MFTRHKAGDQVHRAGAVQRIQGNQVFQARGLGVFQHALHAARLELEHRFGLAFAEQAVHPRIVERQVIKGKIFLPLVPLDDELARNLQNGQGGQAQKVELHQANGLHVVLIVLTYRRLAARLLIQRAKVGQFAGCNQHTPGVHTHVAGHALELAGQLQQGFDVFLFAFTLGQNGLVGGVNGFVVFFAVRRGQLQAHAHTGFIGDELADAVTKGVAHVQHAAHIPHGGTRRHGAKSHNLAHGVFAVFVFDVVNHQIAVGLAKVDVKVGHGHPLGVQKTLEQQVVLQRVQVGNLHGVGHQGPCARAPARSHRATVVFGPVDEVAHDQKVTRKAHFQDGANLKLQTLHIARALKLALGLVRVQVDQALFQALVRGVAKVLLGRHVLAVHQRGGEFGQLRLVEHQRQIAALGNFKGIGQRGGNVGKKRLHLGG